MMQEISDWLENGANYQQGVSLYDKYGEDNFLKKVFARGENAFNKKKLTEELCKIEAPKGSEQVKVVLHIDGSRKVPSTPPRDLKKEAPILSKLINQRDNNYATMRGLHPYLSVMEEGEEMRKVAEQIVQLGKKNAVIWERIDYINQNGEAPEDEKPSLPPIMIDIRLLNKRELVRKSLNKAENRAKKQGKMKPHTMALINARREELALIDQEIARIKAGGAQ